MTAQAKTEATNNNEKLPRHQFAILELEKPVTCSSNSLVIGSKLDTDIHSNTCRIAFHGAILEAITDLKYTENILPNVKVFKNKFKEGIVERKADEYAVICRGLFKKETNIELFVGMKVKLSTGEAGMIEGGFGQSGKFKVRIPGKLCCVLSLFVHLLCLFVNPYISMDGSCRVVVHSRCVNFLLNGKITWTGQKIIKI